MTQTRDEFHDTLYDTWSAYFGYPASQLKQGGTNLMVFDQLVDSGWLHLTRFDQHSVIQCDPAWHDRVNDIVQAILHQKGTDYPVIADDIDSYLSDQTIDIDHVEIVHYLYPADFEPAPAPSYAVRQLSDTDQDALEVMKSACTVYEFEDSWVSATDELAFGAFDGEQLVACASMYMWRGFADPGVLVHPDYRRKGLGRAVVSALCDWVLDQGRVMDYRCTTINPQSAGLATSLGFRPTFKLEVFKIVEKE